jgi:hypothetical protein
MKLPVMINLNYLLLALLGLIQQLLNYLSGVGSKIPTKSILWDQTNRLG